MPNSLLLPDIRNKIADLSRRIGILERRIRPDALSGSTGLTALATTMIYRSSDQTVASSIGTYPTGFTRVDFNTLVRDELGTADLPSNEIGIPQDGLYLIVANTAWRPDADGQRSNLVAINGTSILGGTQVNAAAGGFSTLHSVSLVYPATAGQVIVSDVLQNSGGDVSLESNGFVPNLSVTLLRQP